MESSHNHFKSLYLKAFTQSFYNLSCQVYTSVFSFVLFFFITGFIQQLSAQDTVYARKVIQTLCSPRFAGRAYVSNGHLKASHYIASEFRKAGVVKYDRSWFQEFPMAVNTIQSVELIYNGKVLKPGTDYLIDPSSPSVTWKGNIRFLNFKSVNSENAYDSLRPSDGAIVLDTFHTSGSENARLFLKHCISDPRNKVIVKLTDEKLTWSSSPRQSRVPVIILNHSVYDRSGSGVFSIKIKSRFLTPCISRNVIGWIPGTSQRDSFIVLTAHHDHLGKMGKHTIFPGANDNASGIAMMLSLAQYFKKNPQPYSIMFIAFSGEENGLVGSRYFVDHPLIHLSSIRFLINLDLMGNGKEGVMAVNGLLHPSEFSLLTKQNNQGGYLPAVKARGKAMNSDHYWFSQAGVPCFFFYLMGPYPHYHDPQDVAKAVPLSNFNEAFSLFRDFIEKVQYLPAEGE